MMAGLLVNVTVIVGCVLGVAVAAVGRGRRRATALATTSSMLVAACSPLGIAVNRVLVSDRPGAADLSLAWSWGFVGLAAMSVGTTVFLWESRRPGLRRPPLEVAWQDGVLQSMVAAKMAVELERPSVAAEVLDDAISSVSERLTPWYVEREVE